MRQGYVLVVTIVALFAVASANGLEKKSSVVVAPAQTVLFDYDLATTKSNGDLPASKEERLLYGGKSGANIPITPSDDTSPGVGTAGDGVSLDERFRVWWKAFKAWWKRTFGDETGTMTSTRGTTSSSKEERVIIGSHNEVGLPIGGVNTDTSTASAAGYTVSEGVSLDVRMGKWWNNLKDWWDKKVGSETESTPTNARRLRQQVE